MERNEAASADKANQRKIWAIQLAHRPVMPNLLYCQQLRRRSVSTDLMHRISFTLRQIACMMLAPSRDHQPESRMREIRQSGSEGGGDLTVSPYPYL